MHLKKLFLAGSIAAMCFVFTLGASAATTSDIITKLQADGASATQIAQVQDFFKSNSNAFTSAQLETVSSNLNQVESIMKADHVTDPMKLPAAAKDQIKNIVAKTASETGITADFGKNTSGVSVLTIIKNGVAYTFASNDNIPKTTGSGSMVPIAAIAAGLLLAVNAAAYMFTHRRNVLAE